MSRKGNCYDNCIMETFFGRLKMRCFTGLRRNIPLLESSLRQLLTISITINNRRIQAKKKDASHKIPGSIHDEKLIIQFK